MSLRSLLVIAHGSRLASSNAEVRTFFDSLRQRLGLAYGHYSVAFLELAEPSIPAAIADAIAAGATAIDVFPYFLAAGRHVNEDVPSLARQSLGERNIALRFLPHLGATEAVVEAACQIIKKH